MGAAVAVVVNGQPAGDKPLEECCDMKTVGGVTYTLSGQMNTKMYNCLNDCVYQMEGRPEAKFCFAMGDQKVECNDDEIGGTLIASQWILTAAHCMFKDSQGTQPQTAAEIRIVLGEHDLQDNTESKITKKIVEVSQIIKHPSYNPETSNNDIALLKLSEEVDLNVYTPSCVANTGDTFEGQKAWVYGWGTTSSGGESPYKLLEVEVPVVSNSVCTTALQTEITDDMLCAGGELNKDGCQGDSGGPLTVEVSGKHVLIGDVSWGNGCGLEGQYGVYGDVAYFRTWVDSTIRGNGGAKYCPA